MVSSCYWVAYVLLAEDVASWNELDRLSWDRERLRYEVNGSRSGFITVYDGVSAVLGVVTLVLTLRVDVFGDILGEVLGDVPSETWRLKSRQGSVAQVDSNSGQGLGE
ncbi:hypothetical protein F2Q69_00055766 [Brassica cretica]|uniref:Uncharacterized protein n=1 Tax=Brassica cretica TaxID=69181 RepID=A0A8S9N9Q7_BRACR|nr:hypothetical protein F2Q69_00055766 [Brassica cretica]